MRLKWFAFSALLVMCLAPTLAGAQAPSDEQIKAYLQKHPEVILEVLSRHKVELYNLVMDGREIRQRLLWRKITSSAAWPTPWPPRWTPSG